MNKNRIKNRRADAMARKDGVLTAKEERRRQIAQWERAWLFAGAFYTMLTEGDVLSEDAETPSGERAGT